MTWIEWPSRLDFMSGRCQARPVCGERRVRAINARCHKYSGDICIYTPIILARAIRPLQRASAIRPLVRPANRIYKRIYTHTHTRSANYFASFISEPMSHGRDRVDKSSACFFGLAVSFCFQNCHVNGTRQNNCKFDRFCSLIKNIVLHICHVSITFYILNNLITV